MTTALAIPTHVQDELKVDVERGAAGLELLRTFEIRTEEDYVFAGEIAKDLQARWKALEERRTEVTGPLNKVLQTVNGWFRPAQTPLKEGQQILKEKISAYILAKRETAARAMHAAAEAARAGDTARAAEQVAAIAPAPEVRGVSVKSVWDFEVVNPDEVPREFLRVDEEKVRAAIWYADTEKTPPRPIAGLRFFLRGQVTVRGGR